MTEAHPNYEFVVSQALDLASKEAAMLDYGCGAGEIVELARSRGLNMVGADVFFGGSPANKRRAERSGQLGRTIFEMADGRLPFPDHSFDIVTSNQVFEHVEDIDLALAEIHRVLTPGGVFLNIFPSIGVLREGHCGVPFAHWLNRWPGAQKRWLRFWRTLGLGYYTRGKSCARWAADFSHYLRRYTHYRTRRAILRAYARHFAGLRHEEVAFAQFRLRASGRGAAASLARPLGWLTTWAIRRLGSMVIIARAA